MVLLYTAVIVVPCAASIDNTDNTTAGNVRGTCGLRMFRWFDGFLIVSIDDAYIPCSWYCYYCTVVNIRISDVILLVRRPRESVIADAEGDAAAGTCRYHRVYIPFATRIVLIKGYFAW